MMKRSLRKLFWLIFLSLFNIPAGFAQPISETKDIAEGLNAGVKGTPTFFLGLTDADHTRVKFTRVIRGAEPYPVFKEAIESLLSAQK